MICPPCAAAALMRQTHDGCRGPACCCQHHIAPYPAPETQTEDDDGE